MAQRYQMRSLQIAWRVHTLMPLLAGNRKNDTGYLAAIEEVATQEGIDGRGVRRAYERWRDACQQVSEANAETGWDADLCNGLNLTHIALAELGYMPGVDDSVLWHVE